MKENKLLTIDQLLDKELIVFMFKQKNGKNPIAFKDVFTKNESKYSTRNKSIFIPKKCFSTLCQQQGCKLELEELGNFGRTRTRTRKIKIFELELELKLEKSL